MLIFRIYTLTLGNQKQALFTKTILVQNENLNINSKLNGHILIKWMILQTLHNSQNSHACYTNLLFCSCYNT